MGFRTLAVEQRSSEVWQLLGAVKTEFGKFGGVLAKTKEQLDRASSTLGTYEVRSRAIERRLRDVQSLPEEGARRVLAAGDPADRRSDATPAGTSDPSDPADTSDPAGTPNPIGVSDPSGMSDPSAPSGPIGVSDPAGLPTPVTQFPLDTESSR